MPQTHFHGGSTRSHHQHQIKVSLFHHILISFAVICFLEGAHINYIFSDSYSKSGYSLSSVRTYVWGPPFSSLTLFLVLVWSRMALYALLILYFLFFSPSSLSLAKRDDQHLSLDHSCNSEMNSLPRPFPSVFLLIVNWTQPKVIWKRGPS